MTTRETGSDSLAPMDRFVYQADPDQPPSEAVIDAISAQSDVDDPMIIADAFGPLYDAIDPTALDSLFESTRTCDRSNGSVSFRYANRHVQIDTSGRVELVPVE